MITYRVATNKDCENVKNLVFGVLEEYGLKPSPDYVDKDLEDLESNYTKRGGLFELLENENSKLVGTTGLYPINESHIELRKMYFLPEIRGKGLGVKTLKRMIEFSKEHKYKQIVLETATVLKEAIGLYKNFGFKEFEEKNTPRCDISFYLDI